VQNFNYKQKASRMPNQPHNLIQLFFMAVMAVGAGALDYLYRVQQRRLAWSPVSFLLHLALALFSGTVAVLMVTGMGYSIEFAGAAAGVAGFMNVRVMELFELAVKKRLGVDAKPD